MPLSARWQRWRILPLTTSARGKSSDAAGRRDQALYLEAYEEKPVAVKQVS